MGCEHEVMDAILNNIIMMAAAGTAVHEQD